MKIRSVVQKIPPETTEDGIFPYHTDKNIVLFGGFDSFCAQLQEYFPELRVIPLSNHPDTNLFKNADLIFIQINRLSHSDYWNAIDLAKKANVPFYHLNHAGVKRSASEMVAQIEKLNKRKES